MTTKPISPAPHIFAVTNQKGGVGKTTTAVSLTFALGELGQRVLLVDLDPQGNATSGIGIDRQALESSVYDVLIEGTSLKEVIVQSHMAGVDIAPASPDLVGAEIDLIEVEQREFQLKQALEEINEHYDFVIIDCPPSLGLLTLSALVAASGVIVPVQSEYFALEGLGQLVQSVEKIRDRLNSDLVIEGAVLTLYDGRTNLAREVVEEVRKFFGDKLFNTMIPRNIRLAEAPGFGQTIFDYDTYSLGARAYRVLAQELMDRLASRQAIGKTG